MRYECKYLYFVCVVWLKNIAGPRTVWNHVPRDSLSPILEEVVTDASQVRHTHTNTSRPTGCHTLPSPKCLVTAVWAGAGQRNGSSAWQNPNWIQNSEADLSTSRRFYFSSSQPAEDKETLAAKSQVHRGDYFVWKLFDVNKESLNDMKCVIKAPSWKVSADKVLGGTCYAMLFRPSSGTALQSWSNKGSDTAVCKLQMPLHA